MERIFNFLRPYYLPFLFAFLVGLIAVLPQILAIHALGESYQGIHFLYIDDEDNYMAIIRDVVNGHWLAGSPEFFEYKSIKPIMLPFGAYFYALPIMIFNMPIVWVMLAGKVIFPAILFLLIYQIVKKLTPSSEYWPREYNAVGAGLLATIGYELADYGTVWKFFTGQVNYPVFSLWTRPVNPITGALLVYAFIIVIFKLIETRKKYLILMSGILQASMVYYFFSWGVSLSVSAVLVVIFLVRKQYVHVKNILYSFGIGFLLLLPYWIVIWNSLGTGLGNETAGRNGMFFTHAPIFNKFILIALVIFLPFLIIEWFKRKKNNQFLEEWWWLCLALLGASWWAFNQQIITGRTIWPHHFVQYTAGLCMVVIMVFIFNYVRPRFPKIWICFITVLSSAILLYNIAIASTYKYQMNNFKELQSYSALFEWVNKNTSKDCVVLTTSNAEEALTLITAFTHCNTYVSGQIFMIPKERIMHNMLVGMRLKGIKPENLVAYLYANPRKVSANFQPNWNQLFDPDSKAPWFTEAVDNIVKEYTIFYQNDFATELAKYRLDYVVSNGDLDPGVAQALPGLRFVTKLDKMQVYEFAPEK